MSLLHGNSITFYKQEQLREDLFRRVFEYWYFKIILFKKICFKIFFFFEIGTISLWHKNLWPEFMKVLIFCSTGLRNYLSGIQMCQTMRTPALARKFSTSDPLSRESYQLLSQIRRFNTMDILYFQTISNNNGKWMDGINSRSHFEKHWKITKPRIKVSRVTSRNLSHTWYFSFPELFVRIVQIKYV